MRYVLDASVALRWFLLEEASERAEAVHRRLIDQPGSFAVPELFAFEVFSTMFRVHPRPREAFEEGVLPLLRSGILRYPLTDGIARRAGRFVSLGLSGYDASYAALAEELGAVWLTFDAEAHSRIEREGVSQDLNVRLPPDWQE